MSGQTHEQDRSPERLPIAETFYSVQGEGKLAGVPSYFVRVSGCNLRCGWCDTPYASWAPERTPRTAEELVRECAAHGARHAVITGGEPMLFAGVATLAGMLRASGAHVTIETAGTVDLPLACDLMSISPKLSNSTPAGDPRDPTGELARRHESARLRPGVLQALLDRHPQRQLKFVVSSEKDLAEIDALLATLRGWAPGDILLMPEGVTEPPRERVAWIVRECLARSWRYCPRLHIALFGNRRGT